MVASVVSVPELQDVRAAEALSRPSPFTKWRLVM
jgi:hypothetical protein